jgi:hypothetical protein
LPGIHPIDMVDSLSIIYYQIIKDSKIGATGLHCLAKGARPSPKYITVQTNNTLDGLAIFLSGIHPM